MITKRIIPCLDVKDDKVVKGIQLKNHQIVGSIIELAEKYS
jgi:imidazole glycerol-phosphate synthase subunit HisF